MLLEQELTANSSTKAKGKGKQRDTVLEPKESNYRALRNDFAWQVALAATSLKPSDDYLKEREERTKRIKVRLGQVPFDCLVCFEKIEWEDGARMTDCEHSFCKDCIEGHIQSKLDENQFPITCPVCLADRNRKTRGYVEEALIVDLALPEKLHDKFIELEIAQLSIKIECPGCKNSMQIAREDYLAEAFIWCPLPGCSRQFCRACREITNNGGKGHACKIDEALDELMQANGWRYCPGCRTPTQKVSGCNHMTCGAPGCSTHFCYTCGASIWDNRSARSLADCISTHYSTCVHFDVPNQAPNAPANGVNANANVNPLVARIRNRRRAAECFHQ
ncbi:hypothetical protein BKA70DRAFT_1092731 [Coprinopsis sp. MPI-PUGE-AT-0042]|nr:hypothetical protein BKA70DRAFT_1092731 [Coprinopsis sp. MPI-PUGE-AT-0042]